MKLVISVHNESQYFHVSETTSQQTVSAQENSTKDNLKPAWRTVTAKALKRVVKVPWTGSELAALKRQFGKHYRLMMVPNKADCMRAKDKETALKDRDWKTIKFRVHHDIRKLRHGQS